LIQRIDADGSVLLPKAAALFGARDHFTRCSAWYLIDNPATLGFIKPTPACDFINRTTAGFAIAVGVIDPADFPAGGWCFTHWEARCD
jgi:hypothetical protein